LASALGLPLPAALWANSRLLLDLDQHSTSLLHIDSEIPEISILRTFRSHACPTGEEFVHHSFEVFVRCLQGGRCTICIGLHKSAFSRRHSIENVVIVLELCALL
jgi:hypothetical protein